MFDTSKFKSVSKESVTSLKRSIADANRTGNIMLVLASSKTVARQNDSCSLSFRCVSGNFCTPPRKGKDFSADSHQKAKTKIGTKNGPESGLRKKKTCNPSEPSCRHDLHEMRRSLTLCSQHSSSKCHFQFTITCSNFDQH